MRILLTLLKTLFKGLHKEAAFHKQAEQLHTDNCTLYVASRNYGITRTSESHEPYSLNDPERPGSFFFVSDEKLNDSIPAILAPEVTEMMQWLPGRKKHDKNFKQKNLLHLVPAATTKGAIPFAQLQKEGSLHMV